MAPGRLVGIALTAILVTAGGSRAHAARKGVPFVPGTEAPAAPNVSAANAAPVGTGWFEGWFRFPGEGPQPMTFDDFYDWAEPTLLPDENGVERVALRSDWRFLYRSYYDCPLGGSAESWETKFYDPNGKLTVDLQDYFYPDCSFYGYTNGTLDFAGYYSTVYEWEGPALACQSSPLGTWKWEILYNNQPVDPASLGMTASPDVRTEAKLGVTATPDALQTDLPASPLEAASPGGQSTIIASVVDPLCNVGVQDVPLNLFLEMGSQSGGHTHQLGSRVATPTGSESMVLQPVSAPRGATYYTGSGTLVGSTDSQGELALPVSAGPVSGTVDIGAIVAGPLPPGLYGLNGFSETTLEVRVTGLVHIPDSSSYQLVGSNVYPPPGQYGQNHDENHFVDPVIVGRLEGMAQSFQQDLAFTLEYNDSSLPFGGLFDLSGDFTTAPGHVLHRRGLDQDINEEVILNGHEYFYGKDQITAEISEYVEDHHGRIIHETPLHVRFFP